MNDSRSLFLQIAEIFVLLSESDIQKLALLGLEEKFFITANRAGYDEKEESVLLGLFCFIEAPIESW